MLIRALITTGLVVGATITHAQDFSITRLERNGGEIAILFDLADSVSGRTYTVNVYSSLDNFVNPLSEVTGHVGLEVKPGGNRKITWNAKKELGADFAGELSLEVRGRIYIPFVKLDGFDDYKKFKRLRAYKITWTGGRGNSVLTFELYRKGKKIAVYPNIANVGQYNIKFERGIRPGNNYTFRISDARNKDDVVVTSPFKIRRKTPLLVKALPLAGAGYLVWMMSGGSENNDIPDPPTPK